MPLLMSPVSTARSMEPGRPHPIDRAHVQAVAALGRLAGVAHAERRAEDRRLDVVHRDGVAGEHRLHVAVPDEPLEIRPRARVDQGRPHDPDEIATAPLLLTDPRRELLVVDRPLAAHLGGHEPELVGAVAPAEKSLGVHHDPLASRPPPRPSRSARPCRAAAARSSPGQSATLHDDAIHPRPGRARSTSPPPLYRSAGWTWRRSPRAAHRPPAAARSARPGRRRRAAGKNRAWSKGRPAYGAGSLGGGA